MGTLIFVRRSYNNNNNPRVQKPFVHKLFRVRAPPSSYRNHHLDRARRMTGPTIAGALKCGKWPSIFKSSTVFRPPRCLCKYSATETGTETSFEVWIITHGTLTRPSIPLRSVSNTVFETNSDMSGLMLNKVRLNSLTAAGTSAPTASGAYPYAHAS